MTPPSFIPPCQTAWSRTGLRACRGQGVKFRGMLAAHLVLAAGLTAANALAPRNLVHDLFPVMTTSERQMMQGAAVYRRACSMCHEPAGLGLPGLGTPLVGSPWLQGCREVDFAAILVHGVSGPIPGTFIRHPIMPGLGTWLNDREIADVATFVLRTWGQRPLQVNDVTIRQIRKANPGRLTPWTLDELSRRTPTKPLHPPVP
jgi:mono/diheme cytochrome c family protein